MNKFKIYVATLICMMLVFATSCNDSVEYEPAVMEGSQFYFSKGQNKTLTISNNSGSIYLEVYRADKSQTQDVVVTTLMADSLKNKITIPETLTIRAGKESEKLRVKYSDLIEGVEYKFTISLAGDNPYANSTYEFVLTNPKEVVYEWEVVTDSAYLIDNMFAMNGVINAGIMNLTVEKAKGHNIYRFQSPYDNEYMKVLFGNTYANFYPEDYEFPYIILDGESYPEDGWYIPTVKLGFKSVLGSFPVRDDAYETFGSVAVNLSSNGENIPSDSKDFPLGTYNSKMKLFDFGVVYHQIDGYGYFPYNAGTFLLYLDSKLMTPDINRDYTWEDRPELTSFYTTTLSTNGWEQAVQQTKEDNTLYRFVEPYAQGANIAFYFNKETGYVSVIKGQNTGLTTNFGNPVYIEGTPGVSKYDEENEILTLGYTFYITDANGNKTAELYSSVETVLWGHATEVDQFVPGTSINDYVGTWATYGANLMTGAADTVKVTVEKIDETSLKIKGLANIDTYNDDFVVNYDKRTGFLTLKPQKTANLDGGTVIYYPTLTLMSTTTGAYTMSEKEYMIGGLTKYGKFKFVNAATNSSRFDVLTYVAKNSEGYFILGDQNGARYSYLNWIKTTPDEEEDEDENIGILNNYAAILKNSVDVYRMPFNIHKSIKKPRFENPFSKMSIKADVADKRDIHVTSVSRDKIIPFKLEAGVK